MSKGQLKYEKAWDNLKKIWVTPDEIDRAEAHDRNRYFSEEFSEDEDKGKVLTLCKKSKTYKNKNGKEISARAHFAVIADNTKLYRKATEKKIVRQESIVHKLCKDVIRDIEFIKVPKVNATILGREIQIIPEQHIKITKINSVETRDEATGKIPDAKIEANLLGKNQEIAIEFMYKHAVDEQKKKQYMYYNINCLEVDISDLRDNLDDSEKTLRKKIKDKIENECYWVSNRAKEILERNIIDKHVRELSIKKGNLNNSIYYTNWKFATEDEWYGKRLFAFKDTVNSKLQSLDCYMQETDEDNRAVNIGSCLNCTNCIYINNYYSKDTNDVVVYCRADDNGIKTNPAELIGSIINDMLKNI